MRPVWFLTFVVACTGSSTYRPRQAGDQGEHSGAELAGDDDYKPTYSKAELGRALIAERGLEATAEKTVNDYALRDLDVATNDPMRVAVADLAVRRRFITSLEVCQATGRDCPPRLDDPPFNFDYDRDNQEIPIDAPVRFDLASWQAIGAEMFGRACACRTAVCLDAIGVAIDQLETKPMSEVQGDEVSSLSITRARECLFRLRGKAPTR